MPASLVINSAWLKQLFISQQKLQTIRCGIFHSALVDTLASPFAGQAWFASLRYLSIPSIVGDLDDLRGCNMILKQAKHLKAISLPKEDLETETMPPDASLSDTRAELGLFARTLFSHIAPFGDGKPLALEKVIIRGTDIRYADRSWLQVFDYAQMQCLVLRKCIGTCAFPDQLATRLSSFETAFTSFEVMLTTTANVAQIERFLDVCSRLRNLTLSYHVDPMDSTSFPANATLLQAAATLKVLMLDVRAPLANMPDRSEAFPPPPTYIQALVSDLPELQELAIGFPECILSNRKQILNEAFRAQLEAVAKLPKLRALRILSWPEAPDDIADDIRGLEEEIGVESEFMRLRYLPILDNFAAQVAKCIDGVRHDNGLSPLRALCIGSKWEQGLVVSEDGTAAFSAEPVCYVTRWQLDFVGQKTVMAVRVSGSDVYYDEAYEILRDV